ASGRVSGVHEIAGHFGLAINHDAAANEIGKVDAQRVAVKPKFRAIVVQALSVHTLVDAQLVKQIHRSLFKHACADAAEDVFGAALLDDDRIDTGLLQKAAEGQSRRSGANDCDLCAHCLSHHGQVDWPR